MRSSNPGAGYLHDKRTITNGQKDYHYGQKDPLTPERALRTTADADDRRPGYCTIVEGPIKPIKPIWSTRFLYSTLAYLAEKNTSKNSWPWPQRQENVSNYIRRPTSTPRPATDDRDGRPTFTTHKRTSQLSQLSQLSQPSPKLSTYSCDWTLIGGWKRDPKITPKKSYRKTENTKR